MGAAEPGEALVSRNLLNYVSPDLCARELPPIKVKGKEQPVAVCVLEEEGASGAQIRGGAGSSGPSRAACSAAAPSSTDLARAGSGHGGARGGTVLSKASRRRQDAPARGGPARHAGGRADRSRAPPASNICRRRRSRPGSTCCTRFCGTAPGRVRRTGARRGAGLPRAAPARSGRVRLAAQPAARPVRCRRARWSGRCDAQSRAVRSSSS